MVRQYSKTILQKQVKLGDKPLVTFNRENPGAGIGSKMAVKNKIQVVAEKFKRFDLKQDKKDNKLEKQKKKEGKKARKNKKKVFRTLCL